MDNIRKMINEIYEEGFLFCYEWKDGPNIFYKEHSHKGKTVLHVIDGEAVFTYTDNKETINLQRGKKFYPDVGRSHIATVGSSGWWIIVGEMIEGDS